MNIRKITEKKEKKILSSFGYLSKKTKGRKNLEKKCKIRTTFQVDRDRIVYSNAFRRLKHKTQVFLNPIGDEYRTRLTHTLEVAEIARTIARALGLNEDLTEAIALGHDLGHPPFGHSGETILKEIHSPTFSHIRQGLRIVRKIENGGRGLNLTSEVINGILKHSKGHGKIIPDKSSELPNTVEGRVVRISDIMAYINHDLDDAIRSKVVSSREIPKVCENEMGSSHQERALKMITDIIENSYIGKKNIKLKLSRQMFMAIGSLRKFLYKNVYRSIQIHNEFIKAKKILSELYYFFYRNKSLLYKEMNKIGIIKNEKYNPNHKEATCDFIASLTDRHALNLYKKNFFPSSTV